MLANRKEDYLYDEYEIPARQEPEQYHIRRPLQILNGPLRSRCCLLLIMLSVMAMVVTFRSGLTASRGYDIVQTEQETSRLERENERLRLDIAYMKSPQRIKAIATQQLNMVVPETVYFAAERHE